MSDEYLASMATFTAQSRRVVSLVPPRFPARTVPARPVEQGREPARAKVRRGGRATLVAVLRVEVADFPSLETESERRSSSRCRSLHSHSASSRADWRPSRNCRTCGAASARSSPPARKGRSEAEWLDGAGDRRTIRARDGRRERRPGRSARGPTRRTRRAGLDDKREVAAR